MKRSIIYIALAVLLHLGSGSTLAKQGRGVGPRKPPRVPSRSVKTRGPANASQVDKQAKSQSGESGPKAHKAQEMGGQEPRTVQDHLDRNTRLASKLQALLPPETNLQEASAGFKNLGQFVAAVHVSHNLAIPFEDLRLRMVGDEMTGIQPKSLGQAIQELKPEADVRLQVREARKQAKKDVEELEVPPSVSPDEG